MAGDTPGPRHHLGCDPSGIGTFEGELQFYDVVSGKVNVGSVDIRDIGGGGFHYGDNGATHAQVGDQMGRAVAKLLQGE